MLPAVRRDDEHPIKEEEKKKEERCRESTRQVDPAKKPWKPELGIP